SDTRTQFVPSSSTKLWIAPPVILKSRSHSTSPCDCSVFGKVSRVVMVMDMGTNISARRKEMLVRSTLLLLRHSALPAGRFRLSPPHSEVAWVPPRHHQND